MSDVLLYFKTDPSAVYAALARKVESDVCAKCDKYSECRRKGLSSALFQLSRATLIKNKAAVSSLPPLIDKECKHLATIVGSTYNRSLETRKDILEIRTQNKIRSSLSGTLSGIKDILEQERKNVAVAVGFDFAREEAIREELAAAGVFCSSALVSMEENFSVILLVRADAYSRAECEAAVSRVLKVRCAVKREDNSVIRGWSVITLTEKPIFAAVIGVAQKPKTVGSTGDSHSFEKIDDKIMCALCDGMGSGEKAAETSDKALSLIEDFYRAGFDHNLTVRSVNSFLKVDSQDTFSALDVLVFDTRTGVADVVKLASPPSFVKKSEVVVRLDSSSLPLGIVGEITPSITTRQVEDGDVFVLVSDGVADCFDGDALSGVINNADGRNPQKLAEYVLGEAIRRKTKDKEDDMTVLTCGIFCDR
jgi:stage II sporulation protein E